MFHSSYFTKDKDVTKTSDIRKLIARRLKLWNDQRFQELISEAEMCNKKLPQNQMKITDEKALVIFSRLIFTGKIREATRFITERQESGGIMMPDVFCIL